MIYNRGDVVLAGFPFSNLTQFKPRPAVVVQSDRIKTGLNQTLLVMITSNLIRTGPTRVRFLKNSLEGIAMGVQTDSVVLTDNIVTVTNSFIYKRLGYCPAMHLIDAALRVALDL